MELYLIKHVVPFSQEPLGYIVGQLTIAHIDSYEDLCDNLFNNALKITSLIQIGYQIISDCNISRSQLNWAKLLALPCVAEYTCTSFKRIKIGNN